LPSSYGFIDTWARVGGIASNHPPRIERISDPFAAMPSLHLAWAVWCAAAVVPAMKRRWTKALAVAYPVVTLIAVVATGNHFVLDTVAGVLLASVSLLVVGRSERRRTARREHAETDFDDTEDVELTLVGAARAAV
jgi:membrane-associated phospholipid phosphatase